MVFHDEIGQPDPQSNIRPFLLKEKSNESPSERYLRERRNEVQKWNHDFWLEQNANFQRCKKQFLSERYQNPKMKDSKEGYIHPDELAEFYRQFLNDNYKMHINYNKYADCNYTR